LNCYKHDNSVANSVYAKKSGKEIETEFNSKGIYHPEKNVIIDKFNFWIGFKSAFDLHHWFK
jgi:hypothetical protein